MIISLIIIAVLILIYLAMRVNNTNIVLAEKNEQNRNEVLIAELRQINHLLVEIRNKQNHM